ncbi:MAG: PQQ-binding-like beta-propeller repeat protein, partial [Bryobacteraceae bacterium]
RASDGKELWRVARKNICERSWGTPLIFATGSHTQIVTNGWPYLVSYDLETGREVWRMRGGGDNPIPSPFVAEGRIVITNSHGGKSPLLAIRPEAKGDISLHDEATSNEAVAWSVPNGGSYISTPVVYGGYIYLANTNGVIRCFEFATGRKMYEERAGTDAVFSASLVASDGKIYCTAEQGDIYVVKGGPAFEIMARNKMGAPCLATPAISGGVLYFRTASNLIAVG